MRKYKDKIKVLTWEKDRNWFLEFKEYEDEVFRKIPGYDGYYFVSNYGKIIGFYRSRPQLLKGVMRKNGKAVILHLNLKYREYYVGKLVYEVFAGTIPDGLTVKHMDGDLSNNHLKNLRLSKPVPLVEANALNVTVPGVPKEVLQFDLYGNYVNRYPSAVAAAKALDRSPYGIYQCLIKRNASAAGYQWYYRSDPFFINGIRSVPPVSEPKIMMFSLQGKYIRSYLTVAEAASDMGIPARQIHANLKKKRREASGAQFCYCSDPFFASGIRDIPAVEPEEEFTPPVTPVMQFDLYGHFIATYPSIIDAAKKTGTNETVISRCVRGLGKTSNNFQWRSPDDPYFRDGPRDIESLIDTKKYPFKPILQFDRQGKFIKRFPDIICAAKELRAYRGAIQGALFGDYPMYRDYQWRYADDPLFKDGVTDIPPLNKTKSRPKNRPVLKLDRQGNVVAEYSSVRDAAEKNGCTSSVIYNSFRASRLKDLEFRWVYKEDKFV